MDHQCFAFDSPSLVLYVCVCLASNLNFALCVQELSNQIVASGLKDTPRLIRWS